MIRKTFGSLVAIHRYPVKSLGGERIAAAHLGRSGIAFDRQFAVLDVHRGVLANAKNEERWPRLYFHRARSMHSGVNPPASADVCITFADGSTVMASSPAIHQRLSEVLGREVLLARAADRHSSASGTYVDVAPLHIVTRASLDMIPGPGPESRIDPARFRANLVIDTETPPGFIEDAWVGHDLALGTAIVRIISRTRRCARITLPQPASLAQPGLLRCIDQRNSGTFGVYAEVIRPGVIQAGDSVRLER
jgi:uncharacterized protein YcbX